MPIKDNKIYCVNHPEVEMARTEDLNALTKLTKKGDQLTFHPSSGTPIKIFICPKCGYIETYFAKMTKFWEEE